MDRNTVCVAAAAAAGGLCACAASASAHGGPDAAAAALPEPKPELKPDSGAQAEPDPEPEPQLPRVLEAAGAYYDSDFAWEDVVEAGQIAVAAHGPFLPVETKTELLQSAATSWDEFYSKHGRRFFKPRAYLLHCFPELAPLAAPAAAVGRRRQLVIEVGCGAGDTAFSLLQLNPDLTVYASDFSATAVETMRANPLYAQYEAEGRLRGFVWDLTREDYCPPELAPALGRADAVVCVFCLSAILPSLHTSVARRLVRMLRPGGVVCFRDYGLYDMSQLRYGRTLRDESRTANHARLIFTYNFEAPYCANSRALEKNHN